MKTALRALAFGLLAIAGALVYGLVQALRGLNELEERRRRRTYDDGSSLFTPGGFDLYLAQELRRGREEAET